MNATQIKDAILAALAAAGAFLANALGGWDALLKLLAAMMAADYITGVVVAAIFKHSNKSESGAYDSKAGFQGLVRKCAIFLLVYIAVLLDNATGSNFVRSAVVLFFIGNEGLSLLENLGLMGVDYPDFMKNMLQALREKGDGGKPEGASDGKSG